MYLHTPNSTSSAANISLPDFFHDELNYQERENQRLLNQIELAFKKLPTKANLLHGERLIKQGSKGRRTALFPSRKAGGSVALESQIELMHSIDLERNNRIQSYRTQAIKIQLPGNTWCYPDFLVLTTEGHYEVHEIKPNIFHIDEKTIKKLKVAEKILCEAGIIFRIIDSSTLPSAKLTDTLLQVYARGHIRHWTHNQIALSIDLIQSNNPRSLVDGYALLKKNDLPQQIFDFLIFHNLVNLPLIKKSIFGAEV